MPKVPLIKDRTYSKWKLFWQDNRQLRILGMQ